jgi:hypothetical protein
MVPLLDRASSIAGTPSASDLHLTYVTRQACGPCISVVSTRLQLATMLGVTLAERSLGDTSDVAHLERSLHEVAGVGTRFLEEAEQGSGIWRLILHRRFRAPPLDATLPTADERCVRVRCALRHGAKVRRGGCIGCCNRPLRLSRSRLDKIGACKAERFIRTLLGEWAYLRLYRSNAARLAALPRYVAFYG